MLPYLKPCYLYLLLIQTTEPQIRLNFMLNQFCGFKVGFWPAGFDSSFNTPKHYAYRVNIRKITKKNIEVWLVMGMESQF